MTLTIKKVRNTAHEIRDTIATVSYRAAVSVEKSCIATQAVCEKLYGHEYGLRLLSQPSSELPCSKKPPSSANLLLCIDVN